jgi:YaaC-like Protein
MPLPESRHGEQLKIAKQEIAFSFWPVGRSQRRYRVQHRVFAADPWPLIVNEIEIRCPRSLRKTAQAFCAQAEDFFKTSFHAHELYAKPLLLYYSMLNLAKAFVLTTNNGTADYRPQHGLRENATARQSAGAVITATLSGSRPSAFNDFLYAISGVRLRGNRQYRLGNVLPQVLTGHRVWCAAANAAERFVGIDNLQFKTEPDNRSIWVQVLIRADDVKRLNLSYMELLRRTRLDRGWRVARPHHDESNYICIERQAPHRYTHRPSDNLMDVVTELRRALWTSVLLVPPYAKYYLYLSPPAERSQVLPQLLSIYLIMFFLSSITRYRPHHFESLQNGPYGAQIEGFLNEAPSQFLYLLASEFLRQEVSKPATV